MELVIGLALVLCAVYLYVRRAPRQRGPAANGGYKKISGPGRFKVEVVGESFFESSFEALLGADARTEKEHFCDAELDLDTQNAHDPLAVAVLIDNRQVGHLNRTMARELRDALARDGLAVRGRYAIAARVYCGGSRGLFSVSVDLPQK